VKELGKVLTVLASDPGDEGAWQDGSSSLLQQNLVP
jgi:hypothetical protein